MDAISTPKTIPAITMQCADCGLKERTFTANGDTLNGKPDYTCDYCGWNQTSTAGGCAELCLYGTWHDLNAYQEFASVARNAGYDVPNVPKIFIK